MLDIIIPIHNEEKVLTELSDYYTVLSQKARLIFVDGGSNDQSVTLARQYGEVVLSPKGRARQKNSGLSQCISSHLLFLHVDTEVDFNALKEIQNTLMDYQTCGCLQMCIKEKGVIYRLFEWIVNARAKYFQALDGDLGLFVHRQFFEELGGFDAVHIMEDILFGQKAQQKGGVVVLPFCVSVSARKWKEQGFYSTFKKYTHNYCKLWFNPQKLQLSSNSTHAQTT